MKKIIVKIAPTLELAKEISADLTVEAEYGEAVVEGRRYTAAHHGPRADRPAPCIDPEIPEARDGDVVLISHIDLDTLGGIGRFLGHPACAPKHAGFWHLAAFVDVNGPHKLALADDVIRPAQSVREVSDLHAYWAWAAENRSPRYTEVTDVTEEVRKHLHLLLDIFGEPETGSLHTAGERFRQAAQDLNENSFCERREVGGGLILRVSPQFVNHLYNSPDGEMATAVAAFNTRTGAITLSFAEKDDPRQAAEVMQAAFGEKAGGHAGIAGSPRGERQTLADLLKLADSLEELQEFLVPAGEPDY